MYRGLSTFNGWQPDVPPPTEAPQSNALDKYFGDTERLGGNSRALFDGQAFFGAHFDDAFDGTETSLWARLSPAIAVCYKVYSRILKSTPLTLVRPNGDVMRWPPQDGREAKSKAWQILRLWEEEPNEVHSPAQFRGMLAHQWIYTGEVIIPQHRWPNRLVRRMFVLPSAVVSINAFTNQWEYDYANKGGVEYAYYGKSKKLNMKVPQFMHLRQNVDSNWPLRGRPAYMEMPTEVAANAISAIYRKEVFRQGGPVRQALEADPESDISTTATESQLERIASKVARNLKRMQAWQNEIVHIPPGFKLNDYGPKTRDEMYTEASRLTDEKLSAAHGVPLMYQGNLENSNYTNARQQVAILAKEVGSAFFAEISQMIEKVQLRPLGGEEAKLKARFDLDHLIKAEIAIWNKIVLDRVAGGVWSVNEGRVALDSEPRPEKEFDIPQPKGAKGQQDKAPAGEAKGVAKPDEDKTPKETKE